MEDKSKHKLKKAGAMGILLTLLASLFTEANTQIKLNSRVSVENKTNIENIKKENSNMGTQINAIYMHLIGEKKSKVKK